MLKNLHYSIAIFSIYWINSNFYYVYFYGATIYNSLCHCKVRGHCKFSHQRGASVLELHIASVIYTLDFTIPCLRVLAPWLSVNCLYLYDLLSLEFINKYSFTHKGMFCDAFLRGLQYETRPFNLLLVNQHKVPTFLLLTVNCSETTIIIDEKV